LLLFYHFCVYKVCFSINSLSAGWQNNLMSLEAFRLLKCQNGRNGYATITKSRSFKNVIETVKSTVGFLAILQKGRRCFWGA
jgi:hypothetical protein